MDSIVSVLPLAVILCAGIFVQSAAGFAAGLLIVPALLWCGYTIPAAQCSLLVATIPQNAWGVWTLRESISLRLVIWPGLIRVLFFPIGVLLLQSMETLETDTIRQIVGAVVLAATVAIIVFRPEPRATLNPVWAMIAFPLSGFLQGLVGMGGPVMVFWLQAHDWGSKKTRAFLFAMYLISIAPGLAILYLFFGARIIGPGIVAATMIPFLFVATHFGLSVGARLGRRRLRRVTLALLFLMGAAGLAAPLLSRDSSRARAPVGIEVADAD
jgi:uncharacterized membrane protein YfcA